MEGKRAGEWSTQGAAGKQAGGQSTWRASEQVGRVRRAWQDDILGGRPEGEAGEWVGGQSVVEAGGREVVAAGGTGATGDEGRL